MQATMGHLERKSNAQRGTVGDEISLSQNFDRLRMTRRGKADFLFAPYARHRFLQNKKDICISKDTYVLILSLTATNIREFFLICFPARLNVLDYQFFRCFRLMPIPLAFHTETCRIFRSAQGFVLPNSQTNRIFRSKHIFLRAQLFCIPHISFPKTDRKHRSLFRKQIDSYVSSKYYFISQNSKVLI